MIWLTWSTKVMLSIESLPQWPASSPWILVDCAGPVQPPRPPLSPVLWSSTWFPGLWKAWKEGGSRNAVGSSCRISPFQTLAYPTASATSGGTDLCTEVKGDEGEVDETPGIHKSHRNPDQTIQTGERDRPCFVAASGLEPFYSFYTTGNWGKKYMGLVHLSVSRTVFQKQIRERPILACEIKGGYQLRPYAACSLLLKTDIHMTQKQPESLHICTCRRHYLLPRKKKQSLPVITARESLGRKWQARHISFKFDVWFKIVCFNN